MIADLEPWLDRVQALLPDTRGHGRSTHFERVEDYTYARTDWIAECARIRCPVLVIAGSQDHFPTVPMSRRVAETIPHARLHVVQGGPHFPNRTHRAEVQAVIGAFLAEIGVLA